MKTLTDLKFGQQNCSCYTENSIKDMKDGITVVTEFHHLIEYFKEQN